MAPWSYSCFEEEPWGGGVALSDLAKRIGIEGCRKVNLRLWESDVQDVGKELLSDRWKSRCEIQKSASAGWLRERCDHGSSV